MTDMAAATIAPPGGTLILAALTLLAFHSPTQAQTDTPSNNALNAILACRAIAGPTDRLACFDRQSGMLQEQLADGSLMAADRAAVKANERATFGLPRGTVVAPPAPVAAQAAGDPPVAAAPVIEEPISEIESRITEAIRTANGFYVLALEDGSIWRTTEQSRIFNPRAGDVIAIERAALGSFLAKVPRSRPVRIQRMR